MSKIRDQVKAFHEKFGLYVASKPEVPDNQLLRAHLARLFEEYTELVYALGLKSMVLDEHMAEIWSWSVERDKIDFPEVMDALGDIDYLSEGFRLICGVDGDIISNEIQRSNMEKTRLGDGQDFRVLKPKNWVGPKIRECLIEQGWKGNNNEQ